MDSSLSHRWPSSSSSEMADLLSSAMQSSSGKEVETHPKMFLQEAPVEAGEARRDTVNDVETKETLEEDRKSASDELVEGEEEHETRTSHSASIQKRLKNDVGEQVDEVNFEPGESGSSRWLRGTEMMEEDRKAAKPDRAPKDSKRIEELRSSEGGN